MTAVSQRSRISGIQDPARAKLRIQEELSSLMPHMLTLTPHIASSNGGPVVKCLETLLALNDVSQRNV